MKKLLMFLLGAIVIAFVVMASITKQNKILKAECFVSKYDNNIQYIFLLPPNKIIYRKEGFGMNDNALFKVYGEEAFNVGPIYQVYSDATWAILGIRYYPGVDKVVRYNVKLNKTQGTVPETTFGTIGNAFESRFIFYPDKLKIGESVYSRVSSSELKEKMPLVMKQLQVDSLIANYL